MTGPADRNIDFITKRPIAHRGLHDRQAGVIENTASAFAAAMLKGYAIECDLQITRDGDAVVFHDETLDRLTERTGWLRDLTAAELKEVPLRGTSDRMQTLAELLAQVNGQVPLVIELKSHWDGDTKLAVRAIEVLKTYHGPYCVMSFDPDLVEAVRRRAPDVIRGIVADRAFDPYYHQLPQPRIMELRTFGHVVRTIPDFVSFYYEELPFAPVEFLRAQGMPLISWTIRNPEQERIARRFSDQITFEGYLA